MSERRTAYTEPVLAEVLTEAQQAEGRLHGALQRLEKHTLEDANRSDWENVPALEAGRGHETESDAQLRVALNDARDALAEVEDLVTRMLNGHLDDPAKE